jgi:hypothetical protein
MSSKGCAGTLEVAIERGLDKANPLCAHENRAIKDTSAAAFQQLEVDRPVEHSLLTNQVLAETGGMEASWPLALEFGSTEEASASTLHRAEVRRSTEDGVIALKRLLDIEPAEIGSFACIEKVGPSEGRATLDAASVETYGALKNHSIAD